MSRNVQRDNTMANFREEGGFATTEEAGSTTCSASSDQPSAVATVFGTYGLLEDILLYLSLDDILATAKCSNAFRNVIESSTPIIQRFRSMDSGFKSEGVMVVESFWPINTAFTHRPDLNAAKFAWWHVSLFIVRRGRYETIAVLYESRLSKPKFKIVNGRDVTARFEWTRKQKYTFVIEDAEMGVSRKVMKNFFQCTPLDRRLLLSNATRVFVV